MAQGKYVVLEGGEGAGKTTQVTLAAQRITDELGFPSEVVREPGGEPAAEELRSFVKHTQHKLTPWAETFIFNACRALMLEHKVAPMLEKGIWVFGDRSYFSTMAYQGHGNSWSIAGLAELRQICQAAIKPAWPDLIIVLNISLETSRSRITERNEVTDRFEARDNDYHGRVLRGYIDEARYSGCPYINAEQTVQEVHEAIWAHIEPLISIKE